ncbi:hypothetical protein [Mesorhizobium sp. B263B2A]|uniref:hypothetical protein n=1 Tax=Mesorhizobium sp. B263B2A TaxID=2876669 RepID=UPI001CD173E4|nr:hypothetical protein [Mesorhizobium sp. B263B2A]MCA0034894.1 hypothetical protein [Mesorhizobium sp. B263B2A]
MFQLGKDGDPSRTPQPSRLCAPIHLLPQGEKGKPRRATPQLPKSQNIDMSHAMEELFGDPAYKGFVLQDRKRLPSRFSARVSGALTSRLS